MMPRSLQNVYKQEKAQNNTTGNSGGHFILVQNRHQKQIDASFIALFSLEYEV